MEVSQLVRDLELQLQHQHGEEPVVRVRNWGGRYLGGDVWL